MCECGCGDQLGIGRVAAGPGVWLVLEVYPGCQDCGTDWAVGLTRVKEGTDDFRWFCEEYPVIEFDRLGMWGKKILDTEILKQEFMKEQGTGDDLEDTVFAFTEFVDHGGLRHVHFKTMAQKVEAENG